VNSLLKPLNLEQILLTVKHNYHDYLANNKAKLFDSIDSTNNYLLQNITDKPQKKFLCLAEMQTHGKGQRQNTWFSPRGNIYLSLAWQFSNQLQQLSGLSLAISVAVLRALRQFGVTNQPQLKWPNDILYQNKKLAGILIETVTQSNNIYAVMGLGLNFAMSTIDNSTDITNKINIQDCKSSLIDLATIMHPTPLPSRNKLIGLIINNILDILLIFSKHGLRDFINEWQQYNYFQDKLITVQSNDKIITGINQGINANGELLLKIDNNVQAIASGHIISPCN
jgi:BirA family biotin operon repressor/biotin-[acetyl-CoA-carboxylase] ligase